MELQNSFTVNVAVHETWEALTDLKRVATCMPGAQIDEIAGDDYLGTVAVRVGPFSMSYKGVARFTELNAAGYRAVVRAEGRELKGQGTATADIVMTLEPAGTGTTAHITSNIEITGKAAQFGRSMLADVSGKLLNQFAGRLEADLTGGSATYRTAAGTATAAAGSTPVATHVDAVARNQPPANEIDAVGLALDVTAQRLPDVLIAAGLVLGGAGLLRAVRPGSRLLAASALALAAGTAARAIRDGRRHG